MTNSRSVNRSVYEGADMLAMRLRAAKKPAVIPFLEIPPEEIDLEPVTIEPVDLTDAELVPIKPLVVPASEILPFDDDEDDAAVTAEPATANATSGDVSTAPPGPVAPPPSDGLSLFGVGAILDKKPVKDRSGKKPTAK